MKKSLLAFLLALSILISCIPISFAFPDTEGHWAREYIDRAVEANLFNGVSEDRFAPDDTMTRAMFVTVLGRFEGIDVDYWSGEGAPQFFAQDVRSDSYYAPHIRWGVCNGIVNGISDFLFAPDRPITREQMAKLISYYLDSMGHTLTGDDIYLSPEGTPTRDLPDPTTDFDLDIGGNEGIGYFFFADENEISSWAAASVVRLYKAGILTGFAEEDGTITFRPQETATRAQCATVFCRIQDSLIRSENTPISAKAITLDKKEVTLVEGDSVQLDVQTDPVGLSVLWRTSDSDIATVSEDGLITFVTPGEAEVSVYTKNGLYASCKITCQEIQEEPEEPKPGLPNASFTKEQKSIYMFGESVKDPRLYYSSSANARADMVDVQVQAWYLKSNGEKVPRTWTLTVHKNLAETVKAIFEDIFNGPEKFPIHDMYSYSWSGKSEHSIGAAIDINYNENYYCDPNGNAITGSFWKPGENPYSIPPGGDVVKAFNKYGYIWCINWNSGYKDYMHFSFFGT